VNWAYFHPWVLSLGVAAIATAANAVVAVPLSYLLARHRFRLRWLVESVVILPLILPPTVVGFGLMYVIGRSGLYGLVTGHTLLFTRLAAVLASSVVSFPLLVLPVRAAFAAIPREYHEEARMEGLSAWQRFIHVALPLARGGILSGLLLGFARALGEFGATLMLVGTGEKTRTLPIQIYYDAGQLGDYSAAWPAVVALAVTSMAVILLANRLRWLDSEK
jgi:molybdate transport system permease protein